MSRPRFIALLLALVTCAIYLPAGHYGFSAFDDGNSVSKNEVVQNGLSWRGIGWAFTTGHTGIWMPLTSISHMAVCQWFGLNPGAHHLVNVLFHAANTVLLLALLYRLTQALWPSVFAAALFAWHPLHVESVAWITERKDMLSTFFGLAALLAYTRYAQRRTAWDYWQALGFFVLSLMSKPMLVTLPFVLLLLDYWPLKRLSAPKGGRVPAFRRLALEKLPFLALSAALCGLTIFTSHAAGLVNSLDEIPLRDRLENVPLAYSRYLLQMIWPTDLAVIYPVPRQIAPLALAAAVLFLMLISAAVWLVRKRSPYWLFGWLWYLGTLVPVIGLLTFGGQAMANRFTYIPSIGIFLAVALGLSDCASRFRHSSSFVLGAVAVAAACLALTANQLRYWRDDVALFSHVIDATKDTRWLRFRDLGIVHFYLGSALENKGRKAEAMAHYREAVLLRPYYVPANNQLGNALAAEGNWNEAVPCYERALQIEPENAVIHFNLGIALAAEGKLSEAMQQYERALQLKPDYAEAHNQLGVALGKQGRLDAAIGQYQEALRLNPDYIEAHIGLGAAFGRRGQLDEALGQFEAALRLNPENLGALYNAGLAFYNKGQLDEAAATFQKVIKLKPDHADAHNNLGLVFGRRNQWDEAISQFQQTLRLNADHIKARNNLAAALQSKGAPPAPAATPQPGE